MATEQNEMIDLGEVPLQRLIDGGMNAFAVELVAESYVQTVRPALNAPVRFTVRARGEKVRFTLEPAE